ncbi:hypothetical protein [Treponema denticola]|uniref:hypothetical protein n=1 Tax=Treponema denticola TaxID=158 RepID=UPI003D93E928
MDDFEKLNSQCSIATDGGGSILAMFCREAKLETQNRTRMYILQPPRMAVVSNFQEF